MKLVLVQPPLSYDTQADNLGVISQLLEPLARSLEPLDIVLLPEHFDLRDSRSQYEDSIGRLSRRYGCHVVGGSHHEQRDGVRVNAGVVGDPQGQIIAAYEKLRPYAEERARVQEGSLLGELAIGDCKLLVLICADFWFSDVFTRTTQLPDVVLVPAHSVSRKPTPDYSRALWRHLAVARAYEFGVYVGVSDWQHQRSPGGIAASGVGGFADPTTVDPASLFVPIGGAVQVYPLDLPKLAEFRRDRQARGFFWRATTG